MLASGYRLQDLNICVDMYLCVNVLVLAYELCDKCMVILCEEM